MKICCVCMYTDNHPLSAVLHLSSGVFLMNTTYKHAHKHTLVWQHTSRGSDVLVLVMIFVIMLLQQLDLNSAFMCVLGLHVFFSLLMISSSEEALCVLWSWVKWLSQAGVCLWTWWGRVSVCVFVSVIVCESDCECAHMPVCFRGEVQSSRLRFWCSVWTIEKRNH